VLAVLGGHLAGARACGRSQASLLWAGVWASCEKTSLRAPMDLSTCGAAQERLAKLVGKNSPSGSLEEEETVVVPRWSGSGQAKGDPREPKLGLNRKVQAVCSDVASFRFLSNAPTV
jgi:hypothetical protein